MRQIPVIIYGAGGVGSALLEQIIDSRVRVAERNQVQFDVVAVTDSRSWTWDAKGLTTAHLRDIIVAKRNGRSVSPLTERPSDLEILDLVSESRIESGIVVDVTAVDGMEPVIDRAIELGHGVALANKKAMAGPWQGAQQYYNNLHVRHESTVGGGQPVVATLRYLMDVNDPIYHIEGQMSGTLGYICAELDKGVPFSQAVTEAKARGFTEPDPREDLSGMDVMRKVMICGRMAGWPLEASDIAVESLYSPDMATLSVKAFMARLSELDDSMRARVEEAHAQGNVLRYVGEVGDRYGRVGLKPIPQENALADLKFISFRTSYYNDEPLMIIGKGAGVRMTAAGVLGDMIDLAREALNDHKK